MRSKYFKVCVLHEIFYIFSPYVFQVTQKFKKMIYVKPRWESEVFTKFMLLIKLRFLADQVQMTGFNQIFPLISRFFLLQSLAGRIAQSAGGPPIPTMRGSWLKKNFWGSASEQWTRQGLALTQGEVSWEKRNELEDVGSGSLRLPITHIPWESYLTSTFLWSETIKPNLFILQTWYNVGSLDTPNTEIRLRNKTPEGSYSGFFFLPGRVFPPLLSLVL